MHVKPKCQQFVEIPCGFSIMIFTANGCDRAGLIRDRSVETSVLAVDVACEGHLAKKVASNCHYDCLMHSAHGIAAKASGLLDSNFSCGGDSRFHGNLLIDDRASMPPLLCHRLHGKEDKDRSFREAMVKALLPNRSKILFAPRVLFGVPFLTILTETITSGKK